MSNQEFENYLRLIGKLLQLSRRQREQIGAELQDHLESRVADLVELGMDQQAAIGQALEEFGDAAVMAKNFQTVSQLKRRRWMMRFATFSIAGCFLAAVLTMAMWPAQSRFGAPDRIAASSRQDAPSNEPETVSSADHNPFGATPNSNLAPVAAQVKSIFHLNEMIEARLKELDTMDYKDVEWAEVRRDLWERYELGIVTDQTALDDKLTEEEPMALTARNLPLEVCLVELLKPKNATFLVKDGILRVISLNHVDDPQFLTTRTYDCRRLIESIDLQKSSSMFDQQGNEMTKTTGTSAARMFGLDGTLSSAQMKPGESNPVIENSPRFNSNSVAAIPTTKSKEDFLIQLISIMVGEADKWSTKGQAPYSISVVNGFLVVAAPREVHRETESFLQTLERTIVQ